MEFWDTVAHHEGGGSGPSYLSGWVTVFACFKANGEWQGDGVVRQWQQEEGGVWPAIDTGNIPIGAVSVPVKLDDNGKVYAANMTSGQMVYEVIGKNSDTIQPRSDWCFAIKKDE